MKNYEHCPLCGCKMHDAIAIPTNNSCETMACDGASEFMVHKLINAIELTVDEFIFKIFYDKNETFIELISDLNLSVNLKYQNILELDYAIDPENFDFKSMVLKLRKLNNFT